MQTADKIYIDEFNTPLFNEWQEVFSKHATKEENIALHELFKYRLSEAILIYISRIVAKYKNAGVV